MRFLTIFSILFLLGCSKRQDLASKDSLFVGPMKESVAKQPREDSTGLYIDSFVAWQQSDIERLKRFDPLRVVEIYDGYRSLRNSATTEVQLDSFLAKQKITPQELHSVLTEGDRLGWASAHHH